MRVFVACVFYLMSVVFVWAGFDKMLNYQNSSFGEKVNVYVGGDAYNYIINANLAGTYFTLALICVVVGSTLIIAGKLEQLREALSGERKVPVPVVGESDGLV